jgi:hypothetical protein
MQGLSLWLVADVRDGCYPEDSALRTDKPETDKCLSVHPETTLTLANAGLLNRLTFKEMRINIQEQSIL